MARFKALIRKDGKPFFEVSVWADNAGDGLNGLAREIAGLAKDQGYAPQAPRFGRVLSCSHWGVFDSLGQGFVEEADPNSHASQVNRWACGLGLHH